MVSAMIRTIFAQPDQASVHAQLEQVAGQLDGRLDVVSAMLRDAKEDLLAFSSFPQSHWTKIWSNNPLERVNAEIKRRTRVVGIFPNDASALRLITAVCVEQHDEWIASERRYLSEQSMAQLASTTTEIGPEAGPPTLMALLSLR